MADNEFKIRPKTRTEADAYALLAKIQKRRIEIQKEIIEMDSALGLDSAGFFRNRRSIKERL